MDRFSSAKGTAGRRSHIARQAGTTDDAFLPTDAGAHQEIVGIGPVLEDLCLVAVDALRRALDHVLEQNLDGVRTERDIAEFAQQGEMPSYTFQVLPRRRCPFRFRCSAHAYCNATLSEIARASCRERV